MLKKLAPVLVGPMMVGLCLATSTLVACASSTGSVETPDPVPTAVATAESVVPAREPTTTGTWLVRRAEFKTALTREAPVAKDWPHEAVPAGAEKVAFKSGDLDLWGWWLAPKGDAETSKVVIYLHGGFALKESQLKPLRAFVDAGFAVFTPTLRGRNGNGGSHELIYGEVDDAHAAVAYAAERPGVDKDGIYVIGHSMGGATAAMLAFYPDLPLKLTASIGGIYSVDTFKGWAMSKGSRDLVRFDVLSPDELELRVIGDHAPELVKPHVAYMGLKESTTHKNALAVKAKAKVDFEVEQVPGGHMDAVEPALAKFLARLSQ